MSDDTPTPDVQAEKLRSELALLSVPDGYEIVVQPKGLAELKAGFIADFRSIAESRNHFSLEIVERLGDLFRDYDTALASLGKRETAGGGA